MNGWIYLMENRQDKKDHQTTYTWPHTAEHIHRSNSHQTRQDRHACLSTAAALAARPPTRSDVVRHAKCKHAVDCCLRLNVKFSTKRHATMVIGHLSVQTVSRLDQFTAPDTTQTGLSCLAGGVNWALRYNGCGAARYVATSSAATLRSVPDHVA